MKFISKSFGDYNKSTYKTGKHEFITVPSFQSVEVNENIQVNFSAEDVYINGIQLSNDDFQKLINIYSGRQKKAKKLTKRVNEIKKADYKKCVYDACDQAARELNIR